MKKNYVLIIICLSVTVLFGFQFADEIGLHLLQSPGAEVEDYIEVDYGLGSGHADSLMQFPHVKKGERTEIISLTDSSEQLRDFASTPRSIHFFSGD